MKRTVHYWLLFVMGLGLGGCAGLSHSVTSTPPDEARVSGGVAGEQAAAEVPGKEATAAEVTLGDDATEAEYLRYAALHNPALEAAFYGWQASREEAEQAGSLSNPMFSYRYFIEEEGSI